MVDHFTMKLFKHGSKPWTYSIRKQCHITHKVTQRVERFHRDLKEIIAKLVNNDSAEWYQQVPPTMWSIRSSRTQNTTVKITSIHKPKPGKPLWQQIIRYDKCYAICKMEHTGRQNVQ
jgi:hypothetical protein